MDIEELSIILLGVICLIIIYAFIGGFFEHKQLHFIHQTGVGIIIGIIFGLVFYFLHDLSELSFDQELFFYALLPPMIFAGGYNLKKKKFFQNFKYILLFGLFGTITSFACIFGLTYLINQMGWIYTKEGHNIDLSLALMIKYSATICASDSVAALTLIKPKEYPKLFAVIFGEGMVNDAVAIILFKVVGGSFDETANTLTEALSTQQSVASRIFGILGSFLLTIVASLLIGIIIALFCSKCFQMFRFLIHNPVNEVIMLYLFGIMSYVIAQILDMSGVLAVLVCGVCLAHFNFYNLSITGQLSTGVTFQSISFIAEAFVFVYLGISMMYYITEEELSFGFLGFQLLICVIARNIAIFGLSIMTKLCMKKWAVSWYQLSIVSVAGTIRGSVAFALILTIEGDTAQISIVKSTVLLMVFITTIILGGLMPNFIKFCLNKDKQNLQISQPYQSLTQSIKTDKPPKQRSFFKMFDQQYLKPFFIYNFRNRRQEIKEFKKLLKLNSPQYKGGQFVALMKANARQSIAVGILNQKSLMTNDPLNTIHSD